ncbi:NAD(P)-binding domain-containing protein [Nguyenibacter sp. L1]|nr:NAD(P)-binding domain-containing protein [Nguyenibacter sp. L1]WRH89799.1 NAD(P)-binding domain-containing protein [Nguyenibacter sp. L1]
MKSSAVTVVGLGQMGAALVPPFLRAGEDVTVWNRSPQKAEPLVAAGARLAADVKDAISSSDLIIVCLADYATSDRLLRDEMLSATLRGKTVVQLTTGTGAEARDAAAWAHDAGVTYLDGAIMDYPTMVGSPECMLLISGAKEVYDQYSTRLGVLGGRLTYAGPQSSAANVLDGGLLTMYYGNALSFMQSSAMLMAEGIDAGQLEHALQTFMPVITATYKRSADAIQKRDYSGNEASVQVHTIGVQSLLSRAEQDGIEHRMLKLFADYLNETLARGHKDAELPAVFELFSPK